MVNMFANDGQRIIESCAMSPLVVGGPLVALAATIYCCLILSPWALVGTAVFLLFYPYQVSQEMVIHSFETNEVK